MGQLVYTGITSLDGYLTDDQGDYGWAEPDAEVFDAVSEEIQGQGVHLYGRRMYEEMVAWDTMDQDPELPEELRVFAHRWQAAEKVVFSRTLDRVSTGRTRLERDFDPDAVRKLVAGADTEAVVSGPTLAAEALRAGLVDEVRVYLLPVLVGGGLPFFPAGVGLRLELVDERRFTGGTVYAGYRVLR